MKIYLFEHYDTNDHALFTDEKKLKEFVTDYKKTYKNLFDYEPVKTEDYQIETIETDQDFNVWWNS